MTMALIDTAILTFDSQGMTSSAANAAAAVVNSAAASAAAHAAAAATMTSASSPSVSSALSSDEPLTPTSVPPSPFNAVAFTPLHSTKSSSMHVPSSSASSASSARAAMCPLTPGALNTDLPSPVSSSVPSASLAINPTVPCTPLSTRNAQFLSPSHSTTNASATATAATAATATAAASNSAGVNPLAVTSPLSPPSRSTSYPLLNPPFTPVSPTNPLSAQQRSASSVFTYANVNAKVLPMSTSASDEDNRVHMVTTTTAATTAPLTPTSSDSSSSLNSADSTITSVSSPVTTASAASNASNATTTTTAPTQRRPKRKYCCVLDLDETLLHSFFPDKVTKFQYDFMVRKCQQQEEQVRRGELTEEQRTLFLVNVGDGTIVVLMFRPFLRHFLRNLFADFDVGVWSAGGKLYVEAICNVLFPPNSPFQPVFRLCWDDVQHDYTYSYTKPMTTLTRRFPELKLRQLFLVDNRRENGLHFPAHFVLAPDYLPRPWDSSDMSEFDQWLEYDAVLMCHRIRRSLARRHHQLKKGLPIHPPNHNADMHFLHNNSNNNTNMNIMNNNGNNGNVDPSQSFAPTYSPWMQDDQQSVQALDAADSLDGSVINEQLQQQQQQQQLHQQYMDLHHPQHAHDDDDDDEDDDLDDDVDDIELTQSDDDSTTDATFTMDVEMVQQQQFQLQQQQLQQQQYGVQSEMDKTAEEEQFGA